MAFNSILPCGKVNRSTPLNHTIETLNETLGVIIQIFSAQQNQKTALRAKDVALPMFWGLIVLLGVVGNLMVIVVILKGRQLRSTTNVFILNLSISDFLFIVCTVPFTLVIQLDQNWIFGDVWCKVMHYSQYVSCLLSIYTLVVMSMDRYLAIVHPLSSVRYRRVRHAGAVVGAMWPIILVSMVPVLLSASVVGADACDLGYLVIPESKNCLLFNSPEFVIVFFAVAYAVPLSAIVVMYALMLKRVWTRVGLGVMNDTSRNKSKRKVTRMIVVIVAVFGLCWLPLQVYLLAQMVDSTVGAEEWQKYVLYMANALAYSNSSVNPLIYAFFSVQFRRSFMQVFPCCFRSRPNKVAPRPLPNVPDRQSVAENPDNSGTHVTDLDTEV
ncbi:GALR2 [Branchiostoma lanceolatum]|uniref:GALR2 protein n=1 Tax=Branchiostoma lanceolatum TaxID=7740 RepID=A0A8K0AC61_BRALA|nr:GALR2 [Branchiostoma lanceolatum]